MKDKVLFVDDEKDFLLLMAKVIRSWGYQVVSASCADEALDKINDDDIGAIVVDYLMPGVDGIGLLETIRATQIMIPAVVYSAYFDQKTMHEAGRLKIAAFIPKVSNYQDGTVMLKTTLDLIFRQYC